VPLDAADDLLDELAAQYVVERRDNQEPLLAAPRSRPRRLMSVGTAKTNGMDWVRALAVDQLGFYWDAHLWPRLQGLTDEEYWEPVDGSSSYGPARTAFLCSMVSACGSRISRRSPRSRGA
jgi:hypothetical protein